MESELQKLLRLHREKSFIGCIENCFCWDVEAHLSEQQDLISEQEREADDDEATWLS